MKKTATASFSRRYPVMLDVRRGRQITKQVYAILTWFLKENPPERVRVLDVGCGGGFVSAECARFSREVIGIDTDSHALAFARRRFRNQNLSFQLMDARNLVFPSNSFDTVVCHQVLYYIDDAGRVLRQIYRVLKPGGICMLADKNKHAFWEAREDNLYYRSYEKLHALCRFFTVHEMTADILHDPHTFHFARLYPYDSFLTHTPLWVIRLFEPVLPTWIWILEKPPKASAGRHG